MPQTGTSKKEKSIVDSNKNKNLYYPLIFLNNKHFINSTNKNIIMKHNRKCIITPVILFALFTSIVFGIPPLFPVWFVDCYFGVIHIIFLAIFLFAVKYFHGRKCLTTFLTTFITLFILTMVILAIQGEYELKKQNFFYEFNQAAENPNSKNVIGLSN